MSSEKAVVALKLQSGETFDQVLVEDRSWTLATFLDAALKSLEADSKIALPDTEDELVDPNHFHVYDEPRKRELDLNATIASEPYLTECWRSGKTPVLYLNSNIFLDAEQLAKENHVEYVKRRECNEGRPGPMKSPVAPRRTASLSAKSPNREALVYLSGRKEYVPPEPKRFRRTRSPSSLSLASTATSCSTTFPLNDDMMERIIDSKSSLTPSEDGSSVLSMMSSGTEPGWGTRPGSAPAHGRGLVRRGSDVTFSSIQSEPVHIRNLSDDTTGPHPQHAGTPDSTIGVPWNTEEYSSSPNSMASSPQGGVTMMESSSRPAKPGPLSGFPPIVEHRESVAEVTGDHSERMEEQAEGTEVSLLTPPLSPVTIQIKDSSTPPLSRQTREPSPHLLGRPISPAEVGVSLDVSPSTSPRSRDKFNRQTRIATRRKKSNTAGTNDGSGGAEGEGDKKPKYRYSSMNRTQRTIYDKRSRCASHIPLHGRVFGKIKVFIIDFEIPAADLIIEMDVRGDHSVSQMKESLWSELREQGFVHDDIVHLWDPDKFNFTYEMKGETYELYDEQQILQTAAVVQLWRTERREKGHLYVEMKKTESKEEKTLNMEISAMIGIGLYQLQFANNDELDITRRKVVAVRRNAVKERSPIEYSMEVEVTYLSLPSYILEQLHDEKILVRVYYKQGSYLTFQADLHTTADEFLPTVFPDNEAKSKRLGLSLDCNPQNYVLKVTGRESYIHGIYELIQFSYVVYSLSKKQDVELALVKKLDPDNDQLRSIPDSNLIDESTGLTGTHSELSALSKDHVHVFTMSMWDIQRKFRVRVVGLDNLRNTDMDVVYVDAGIYHGGELLVAEKCTNEISGTTYPRWNQWLVFDIAVTNLPKAARLCVQVVGRSRTKDTKKKSGTLGRKTKDDKKGEQADRTLHWVNMQILDHRALLRQGLLRLNLWPISCGTFSPMGSTAINPDGNNSTVLYLELDTYAHSVACPTGGWGEETPSAPDQSPKEGSIFKKDLQRTIMADPLTALDRPQRELIWQFRNHCSTIPEALPKFLRCVDWADLTQVCEAHRLLKIWRPITLEVALELLDYHFADEKVRSLAVHRLEKLFNDELLSFLLQLIQVLKFEPYHDSALGRFLLKRALQSKKIGHFFYWYLRSEMDTPEFNQRFGILLEAYLRGCGEAMFKEIQKQHKAMCDVMAVASSLKKFIERNGTKEVARYAKDELVKYQLPESFSPPYDACLRMGNLDISNCRVMDSKKSPLWLEFENMDPTDVAKRPIKVIAKHGDDLRQDMLTLQMLTLMDKLWQARGLDLYIIPYGCISTGHDMGMIQVVQDAETVAKIQQKHGGSFSALKEEPLHDWLKLQNPNPSRFDAAVERFMLSCAGYCVATYILGIGDRHNDNIMVTKSGNLFHIDFGHFLGNRKEFLGMKRERAPFVLTPDFEYVMGKRNSKSFKKFEETAVKAFMIIRENANLFINLFSMMKCTGIPELRSVEDIDYLREVLVLGKSPAMAEEHFKSQIQKCLRMSWSTQLNWLTHSIVHSHS